jgi:hypothetical protein
MTDVQELKRHIQVLEAHDDIGGEVTELAEKVERVTSAIDHNTDTLDHNIDTLNHNTKELCAAIDRNTGTIAEFVRAYNRLVAPAPPPLADTGKAKLKEPKQRRQQ